MIWLRKRLKCSALLVLTIFVGACGVKGDPLPPERPTQLGRGRPTYRRATEGIKLQKHKPADDEGDEDKDQEENGNEDAE
jgi:hypothetical protein